jgi:hypothetical protein
VFRDLEFFGGAPRTQRPERRVSVRSWRVLDAGAGPGRNGRDSDVGGAPALRFDLPRDGEARLTWTVDDAAADARSLAVALRVRSALAEPSGLAIPDTTLPRVRVRVEGVPGAEASLDPEAARQGRSSHVLSLPLPEGALTAGRPLVLIVQVERAGAAVWFQGAAFHFDRPFDRPAVVDPGKAGPGK